MTINDPTWMQLIAAIHDSKHQIVLAITGGGSGAISALLQQPGGSRTLLEAVVPYSASALADWLGGAPDQACCEATARAMAMASWMRARTLATDVDPHQLIGIGATASLASDRPKRGAHRVHVALQTATSTTTHSLVLTKDQRDRQAEETLATKLLLLTLAQACQRETAEADSSFNKDIQNKDEQTNEQTTQSQQQAEASWTQLLLGQQKYVAYPPTLQPQTIFPGAFNPPHIGHHHIATLAAKRLGHPVAFELSITNVDKPPLDFAEIAQRLHGLQAKTADGAPCSEIQLLTDAPTFRAKAALFPGSTFVVGVDTLARIADPRYYTGEAAGFTAAIQQIANHGCRFLVFGREIEGTFRVLSNLKLPPELRELCDEVTAEEFREDVSSTSLRTK